jgi:Domain of unknown function (DUF4062)
MTHKAFVSSTFQDLKEHRSQAITALRKAGFFVDPMEDWTAATDEPKQFSQSRLNGCDLRILLVGFRRGHVPSGQQHSITQLEYEAARKLGIDVLVFILDEQALWPRRFDELDKDPEIRRWRTELTEHKGVGFFTHSPESIEIAPALTRWLTQRSIRDANETSTRFADEVTQTLVRFLLAIQNAERHAIKQEEYDSAYHDWEVRRATLANRLQTEFRDASLAAGWSSLAEAVTALYRPSGTWSEPYRSKVLGELKTFFSEETNWDCLREYKKKSRSNEDFQNYFSAWWKLREATLLKCGDLTRRIAG